MSLIKSYFFIFTFTLGDVSKKDLAVIYVKECSTFPCQSFISRVSFRTTILIRPCWPSKPRVLGVPPFPDARPTGWGAWHRAQNSYFLWENFCNITILQPVYCQPRGYGIWPYCKWTPPTLPPWFLLYILGCRTSLGAGSSPSISSCSAVNCLPGVLVRKDEPKFP